MEKIVIVGAGECGTRAAFSLRERGFSGQITLLNGEAGLPYERPPLSKPENGQVTIRPICELAALTEKQIDYRASTNAVVINRSLQTVELSTGESLPYDRLLLATGTRVRHFDCMGSENIHYVRTDIDARQLFAAIRPGDHAVLIGAGLIGMELAATLRQAGLAVTVIEAGSAPLGRAVPAPLAARLLARHQNEGVTFRFGTSVVSISEHQVQLSDGSSLVANLVLAAIGVLPNIQLAADAGLLVDNGIVVNHALQTEDPNIFAAGDCARFPWGTNGQLIRLESWRNAQDQGGYVAACLLGDLQPYASKSWFWSDQYDLGLQVAGLPDSARPYYRRELSDTSEILFQISDEGHLLSASGLGIGMAVAKDIRLAEMLIERGVTLSAEVLQDASVSLKSLLKSS